jgi:hypothetical protein
MQSARPDFDSLASDAVRQWCSYVTRDDAPETQEGNRGAMIGGGSMNGFATAARAVALSAGVPEEHIIISSHPRDLRSTLPGFFRTTKNFDFLIIRNRVPVVALEFKSINGAYGKNMNNRADEAIGQGTDLNAMYAANGMRASDFFSGYIFCMADDNDSRRTTQETTLALIDLQVGMNGLSYQGRGDAMCLRLEERGVWTCTSFLTSDHSECDGTYTVHNPDNSPTRFLRRLSTFLASIY